MPSSSDLNDRSGLYCPSSDGGRMLPLHRNDFAVFIHGHRSGHQLTKVIIYTLRKQLANGREGFEINEGKCQL